MKQRVKVNDLGELSIYSENAVYTKDGWDGQIKGDFLISGEDVSKLVLNKNNALVKIDGYSEDDTGIKSEYYIIKDSTLKKEIKSIHKTYKESIKIMRENVYSTIKEYNNISWYKKMFIKLKVEI